MPHYNKDSADPVEPIYGKTYLPRKFKIAIGLPGDNSVDIYANDLGLLAICENWNVVGYNVLVGGSFGVTPSAKKTFPAVALPMCYIEAEQVVDLCVAIVKVQRDFGNRSDRKVARMKYLIHDWGLARFRDKVEEYFGDALPPPRPVGVHGFNDGMGWHEQGDGRWFYGLNVENGRIKDTETMRLKTALREICTHAPAAAPPHAAPEHHLLRSGRSGPPDSWKKFSAATACRSRKITPPSAAGRWPAPPCPPADWPSPRASASCRR